MLRNFKTSAFFALSVCAVAWGGCDDKKDAAPATADAKAGEVKAAEAPKEAEKPVEAEAPAAGDNLLVGTWALDPNAMKDSVEYKNAPDEQKKLMDSMLETMKMEMTFTDDAIKMHADIGGESKDTEGKYTVKATEGTKVTIESEVEGKKETLTLTVENEKLIMEQGGQKMVFLKKA
jgi:hypothetical protein